MLFGCVGGLGEKETSRGFNRATQAKRQTGSAIKPIAILVPGIDKKIFTASTTFVDEETSFNDGSEEGYHPENYDGYMGEITVRQALETSQNIPFVKMMEEITPKTSIKYLEKMGITTLTEKDENLALALGGLDSGMTPLETAAAYATIANDGKYIEPTFYTRIETSEGKKVLESKQKKKTVFSEKTAYIVKELLTQPVEGSNGTATYCKISNMDVAAKTGTTNENYDRWLCGFTPYYTAATWYGFDINETINFNNRNPAGLLWSAVMDDIHDDLSGKSFEKPNGIITCTICESSGKKATKFCGNTYEEYYLKGTEPGDCTEHSSSNKGTKTNNSNKTNSSRPTNTEESDREENKTEENENNLEENNTSDTEIEENVTTEVPEEDQQEENDDTGEEVIPPDSEDDTSDNVDESTDSTETTEEDTGQSSDAA